jgi:hypothetical protein
MNNNKTWLKILFLCSSFVAHTAHGMSYWGVEDLAFVPSEQALAYTPEEVEPLQDDGEPVNGLEDGDVPELIMPEHEIKELAQGVCVCLEGLCACAERRRLQEFEGGDAS